MKLVIAEKPSVAIQLAKVIEANEKKDGYIQGNGYIVSWCIGHLIGLAEPESYGEEYKSWHTLPILPEKWNYSIKGTTKKQFDILKNLMNHPTVDSLVCATDAGREGELIFRHVYNISGCRKPFERLWISSLEDSAIKNGFDNLKNGRDYDNLYYSALCRERADWLVGMNATRLFSSLYKSDKPLSVGRVQTPTLAMIVGRDKDISSFVSKKFYKIMINCGSFTAESERIDELPAAEALRKKTELARAFVSEVKKENKKTSPPKLYDLTTLQRDANRLFGFSASQTLEAAQSLYEDKLITYPRTDSRYLTEDMEETAAEIIIILKNRLDYAKSLVFTPNIKTVMNNKKVSDHHAIIPTANIKDADFNALADTKRKILYLISNSLLCATGEKYVYESTKVILRCCDVNFYAGGNVIINQGYKGTEFAFLAFLKVTDNDKKENEPLPDISEEQEYNVTSKITEHNTKPPVPFTEDTLLSAMERAGNEDYETDEVERKGLGTPATRAAVIETIIARGYVERQKKQLHPTERGKLLISIVPEALRSAKMTAEWENRLVLISKGQAAPDSFMQDIKAFIKSIISETSVVDELKDSFSTREIIGICPRCGKPVYEGKLNFYCSDKACDFALWKNNKYFEAFKKTLTKAAAKAFLENGRVHYKDLWSKNKNKTFEADIVMDANSGKYVNFNLDFSNNPKMRR